MLCGYHHHTSTTSIIGTVGTVGSWQCCYGCCRQAVMLQAGLVSMQQDLELQDIVWCAAAWWACSCCQHALSQHRTALQLAICKPFCNIC